MLCGWQGELAFLSNPLYNCTMKPLFIPLKTRWFRAFAEGIKSIEYRAYGPRWNEATCQCGRDVVLSHGYNGSRIAGRVSAFERIDIAYCPIEAQDLFANHTHLAAITIDLTLSEPDLP